MTEERKLALQENILDLYPDPVIELSNSDTLTIQLLELLDRYYEVNTMLTGKLKEAYSNIQRGNFNGPSFMHFGSDMWDFRPSSAILTVKIKDGIPTFERHAIPKATKVVHDKEVLEQEDRKHEVDYDDRSEKERKTADFEQTTSTIHNRSEKNTKHQTKTIFEKEDQLPVKEPLKMFNGGIVPTSIRKAQNQMKTAMNYVLQSSTLKTQIEEVLDQLEKKKNNKIE